MAIQNEELPGLFRRVRKNHDVRNEAIILSAVRGCSCDRAMRTMRGLADRSTSRFQVCDAGLAGDGDLVLLIISAIISHTQAKVSVGGLDLLQGFGHVTTTKKKAVN